MDSFSLDWTELDSEDLAVTSSGAPQTNSFPSCQSAARQDEENIPVAKHKMKNQFWLWWIVSTLHNSSRNFQLNYNCRPKLYRKLQHSWLIKLRSEEWHSYLVTEWINPKLIISNKILKFCMKRNFLTRGSDLPLNTLMSEPEPEIGSVWAPVVRWSWPGSPSSSSFWSSPPPLISVRPRSVPGEEKCELYCTLFLTFQKVFTNVNNWSGQTVIFTEPSNK